jgi:uncharacterized protein with GYD domain
VACAPLLAQIGQFGRVACCASLDHQGVTGKRDFQPCGTRRRDLTLIVRLTGVRQERPLGVELAMRSYVILLNWTDQGAKNSRDTLKRAKSFRGLIESRGGKLREHLYTLGEYDIVMVTEFPDDDTAAATVLQLASLGNVRTNTMRAFTDQETAAIIPRLPLSMTPATGLS